MKEAVEYTDMVIQAAKRCGETTIKLIVGSPIPFLEKNGLVNDMDSYPGQGLHSNGGVARLKPAIEALMRRCALGFHTTPVARTQPRYFTSQTRHGRGGGSKQSRSVGRAAAGDLVVVLLMPTRSLASPGNWVRAALS